MFSSATLIAAKLIPDPYLSALMFLAGDDGGCHQPLFGLGSLLSSPFLTGKLVKGEGKIHGKEGSLSNGKLAPVQDLTATSGGLFTFFPSYNQKFVFLKTF